MDLSAEFTHLKQESIPVGCVLPTFVVPKGAGSAPPSLAPEPPLELDPSLGPDTPSLEGTWDQTGSDTISSKSKIKPIKETQLADMRL